jgi:tetratricopeptide (TPR) repeat protein
MKLRAVHRNVRSAPVALHRPGIEGMEKRRMNRKVSIGMVFLLLAGLFGLQRCGGGTEAVIGREPYKLAVKVENNVHAIQTWAANGASADILLHIDASDDLRIFPEHVHESMQNAADHLKRKNVGVIDRISELIEPGGTVNIGYLANMYERVIWVMPSRLPIGEDPEGFKNALVVSGGYRQEDVTDLTPEGGYMTGELAGVPITITRFADLGPIDGNVILDIDLGYFTAHRSIDPEYQIGTKSLVTFLEKLAELNVRARFATVNMNTLSGIVPLDVRFFGEVILDAFATPSWLEEMPEKWANMISAESLMVAGHFEEAESVYTELVVKYPFSPGLHFSLATVRGFLGDGERSRQALVRAFELDGSYLGGFFQLANVLAAGGKAEAGSTIVATPRLAKLLSPVELDLQKGLFYLSAKRPYDALTHLRRVAATRSNDFGIYTVIYRAYKEAEDKRQMVSTLERLRRIDEGRLKREMPWIFKEIAEICEESKIYGNALELYEIYLGVVPDDPEAPEIQEKILELQLLVPARDE